MNVKGKYIKDENGTTFFPIINTNTIFDSNGISVGESIGNVKNVLDDLEDNTFTTTTQSKSVTITENGITTITPDTGYDALSSVTTTVNSVATLQSKTLNITSPATKTHTVSPDSGYDGLSSVAVTINVNPSVGYTTYTSGISGNSTVTTFSYTSNNTATHFWLYIWYNIGNTSAIYSSTITVYLQGSQDNSSWTNINSFSKTRGVGTTISFGNTWSNISGYKYYRIRVNSTDNETTVSLQNFRVMM